MSTSKYSGPNTITQIFSLLKNRFGSKVDAAYTHSQAAHAPANAERNALAGIQANGVDVTIDGSTRKANLTTSLLIDGKNITPNSMQLMDNGVAVVDLYKTSDGRGVVTLRSKTYSDQMSVQAYALSNGSGGVITRGATGERAVVLSTNVAGMNASAGAVVACDSSGEKRAILGVDTDGNGAIKLIGADGVSFLLTADVLGSLKGEKGDTGPAYTLSEADKQTLVDATIAALPVYSGQYEEITT